MRLLEPYLWRFSPADVRAGLRPMRVQRDDIVDAAVCLVTAYRVSRGEHTTLPSDEPPRDARGLRMEMVA
jgi:predicted RNase H-like nuclease